MEPIPPDVASYVYRHYLRLLTPTERLANWYFMAADRPVEWRFSLIRVERSPPPLSLFDDPEVLALVADGPEAFQARTARRILDEHRAE